MSLVTCFYAYPFIFWNKSLTSLVISSLHCFLYFDPSTTLRDIKSDSSKRTIRYPLKTSKYSTTSLYWPQQSSSEPTFTPFWSPVLRYLLRWYHRAITRVPESSYLCLSLRYSLTRTVTSPLSLPFIHTVDPWTWDTNPNRFHSFPRLTFLKTSLAQTPRPSDIQRV